MIFPFMPGFVLSLLVLTSVLQADHGYNMDSLAIRILINVMSSHNVSSHFQFLQIITGQYEFACLVLQSKIFLRVFCIGRLLNVDTHSMSTSRQAMRSS
jgi:hypothetical protein